MVGDALAMSRPPVEPVNMELVQLTYEKDASAFVVEWLVPNVNAIKDLSRIELLISNSNQEAIFGVMLNYGDSLTRYLPVTSA